jgi:hypothetical protein
MKPKVALVYGLLAFASLVAAYFTWQRPKTSATPDAVTVQDATKQSLDRVHYEDGTRFLELNRTVEGDPVVWVTQGFLPGKTPVFDAGIQVTTINDGGVDGGSAPIQVAVRPQEPPPTREMRGNERSEALWARFTPLEGTRALGKLPAAKLKDLGLEDSERKLVITVGGAVHPFSVSRQQPGVIGFYLLDSKSQEVFLMQGSLLSELDPSGQVLVDRRPHRFRQGEWDHLTVTAGTRKVDYVQTNADVPERAKLAPAATPDKPDELFKAWHDKVWSRLIVTEVLGKGELPKVGEPTVRLRFDYLSKGTAKGFLELAEGTNKVMWIRTENTASWTAVHTGAEEMALEGEKLLDRKL